MNNNCAVVIYGWDPYSDIREPFFTLFFRYWPDCPFPVYLVSNFIKYEDSRVTSILVGEDKGWATNMKTALRQISQPYVLVMIDDYFLERSVNTRFVESLVEYASRAKAAYIRLIPSPPPDTSFTNDLNLGEISKGASYRTSLQASIWDKDVFYGLLKEGETGWNIEIDGTIRSRSINAPFFSVKEPILHYNPGTAIKRGKWNYEVVRFCRREGIKIDLKKRPVDYAAAASSFLDRIRKKSALKKIRYWPVVGFVGATLMKLARKLLAK